MSGRAPPVCLRGLPEVAAGAGSIARWMRQTYTGRVTAVDIDAAELDISGVEVIQGDVAALSFEPSYDLVHARFLLDIVDDVQDALTSMISALRPAAYLVIEEFDDVSAHEAMGPPGAVALHGAAVRAKQHAFRERLYSNHVGRELAATIAGHPDLSLIECTFGGTIRQGRTLGTEAWARFLTGSRDALMASGAISANDLDRYLSHLNDGNFLYWSPAVVRVVARAPVP